MRGLALAALVAAVVVVSIRWGSFVAGGSDSYCYVHQAERWAEVLTFRGPLRPADPLALEAPWPDAPRTFAPAGHIPSPTVEGAIAPICPAGLSLAMAPFVAAGGPQAAFAVVPLFAALLIVATYAVGARFGAHVGLAGAALTAASPIVLYQAVQPMSDVPAAALWLTAVAYATGTKPRHAMAAGIAAAAAILMRPNLVPLGLVIGLFILLRPERSWRQRGRAAGGYAIASAAGCVAVALIQQALFGSPLSSGYGSLDALFATEHVWPNVQRYLPWLIETHTPVVAFALLAPVLLPGPLTTLFLALCATNLALYLPYVPFEDWSYLRFLLPAVPLLLILSVAVIDAMVRRWTPVRDARPVLAAAVLALAVLFVREAQDRNAFRLQALEARFARAGLYVRDRLPPHAFVVTSAQSGSVRFYAGRKTLVWDTLDPGWLDEAIRYLRERGYEPFLLLERREEPLFRQHFRGSAIGALDWPPAVEIGAQVRIYRPGDRARYVAGTAEPTEYVR